MISLFELSFCLLDSCLHRRRMDDMAVDVLTTGRALREAQRLPLSWIIVAINRQNHPIREISSAGNVPCHEDSR